MSNIIKIECPSCHGELWIDSETQKVIQHKKTDKKNFTSFEDLILGEKEKKEQADEKFELARKLKEEKKKKAEDFFRKSFKD